jgi:anti-anti-sigma factor
LAKNPSVSRTVQFKLFGEFDIDRRSEVKELFDQLSGDAPIVIDLQEVTYVDSSFLAELALLRNRLSNVDITLEGATPNLRRLFQLMNYDKLFHLNNAS